MSTNESIVIGLAIFLGMMVVLIPITGLTLRFALRPLMEAIASYREMQGANEAQQLLERRFALMEDQVQSMDRSLRELLEESEFRRDLESGRQQAAAALPAPGVPAPAQAQQAAQADPLAR
ncbi:MAG TPA: hypothetical protein VHG08_28725 [Longimicrobium sp.]|nr:hypothetical protein [Longimicrobium sp.]